MATTIETATKFHIGCGTIIAPFYFNIDADFPWLDEKLEVGAVWAVQPEPTFIVRHDVRKGIPAKQDSLDVIYHSHFLEHLSRDEGLFFLRECYRCLKPMTGIMRIAVPDFKMWCDNYVKGDSDFFAWYKSVYLPESEILYKTKGQIFSGMLYNWGHKLAYDYETLVYLLTSLGFSEVQRKEWSLSDHIADLSTLEGDNPRKVESLVLECKKTENTSVLFEEN